MIKWYDRRGRLVDTLTATRLLDDQGYKRVARTKITSTVDLTSYDVSTVWVGLDYNWLGHGVPLIFETMVFGGTPDQDTSCWRYATEDDARAGHAEVVAMIAATVTDEVVIELPSPVCLVKSTPPGP
ncbi:hypothetical protein ACIGXM_14530 [Kitasatospora sp. NPDC052896]|uniref:hypothetical protein n=1 Tax=Kitasatospora sp. NPDC052896 TaxID=3364061 RepID=UPI0037CAA5EA